MTDDLATAYKLALEEITRLTKQVESLSEIIKVQSTERWSWSERKTEEVRQLILRGPEVGALVEALLRIEPVLDDGYKCGEDEKDCDNHWKRFVVREALANFKRMTEGKP